MAKKLWEILEGNETNKNERVANVRKVNEEFNNYIKQNGAYDTNKNQNNQNSMWNNIVNKANELNNNFTNKYHNGNEIDLIRDNSGKVNIEKTEQKQNEVKNEQANFIQKVQSSNAQYNEALNSEIKNTLLYKQNEMKNPNLNEKELLNMTKEQNTEFQNNFLNDISSKSAEERKTSLQQMSKSKNGLFTDTNEYRKLNNQVLQYKTQREAEEEANRINNDLKNGKIGSSIGHVLTGLPYKTMQAVAEPLYATGSLLNLNLPTGKADQDLKDWETVSSKYDNTTSKIENGIVKTASNISGTLGYMTPSILTSLMAPETNLGKIAQGVSVAGQSYNENLNDDSSNKLQSLLTGLGKGATSYAIEGITGGNILSKGSLDDLAVKTIASKTSSKINRKIASMIYEVGGETLEEELENQVGYVIDSIVNDKGIKLSDWLNEQKETIKNTALTTITLKMLGLGGNTYNEVKEYENNHEVKEWIDKAEKIINKEKLTLDTEKMKAKNNTEQVNNVLNTINKENNQENNNQEQMNQQELPPSQFNQTNNKLPQNPILEQTDGNIAPVKKEENISATDNKGKKVDTKLQEQLKDSKVIDEEEQYAKINTVANNLNKLYNNSTLGEIKNVPINEILSLKQDGGYRTEEQIKNLKEDISKNGIQNPIELVKNEDGTIKIENGNHRLQIANELGIKEIPIKFVENWNNIGIDKTENNIINRLEGYNDRNNRNSGETNIFNGRIENIKGNSINNINEFKNRKTTERYDRLPGKIQENNDRPSSNTTFAQNIGELEKSSSFNLPKKQDLITDELYREDINEGKIRKHYKSIYESDQIGKVGKEVAKSLLKEDTYVPVSNKETVGKANKRIEKYGVETTLNDFKSKIRSNDKLKLEDISLGERLIQIYSQNGDYDKVNSLIQDVAIIGTELGQQVQALSLIKRASPEGQLQYLTKVVNRMNENFANSNKKNTQELNITKEMTEKILKSKDKEELDSNMDSVKEELAKQLPATILEQIDEWRYLSMLGNPKTHIRNIVSNTAMQLTKGIKDEIAGGIEDTVSIFNKNMERTKTLKPSSKETIKFAKNDAENIKERLTTGGKYDIKTEILQKKDSFNNKILNSTVGKLAEWNSALLEKEDWIALKPAYKNALANYMTANKLTAEYLQSETKEAKADLEKARSYAIQQSQEATFRQYNSLANSLNHLSKNNKLAKGTMDAILPFKKTPLNIAKTGLEYSPAGLLKSITRDTYKLNIGKISVNQYIDNISKGLTGTGITVLGFALSGMGVINGGSDDDKDERFKQDQGEQNYSIKIGDKSYTIDWLSPSAMPLFVGVEIYNNAKRKEENKKLSSDSENFGSKLLDSTENLANSLTTSMNPMTEMSMLSGLTSALKSYSQNGTDMIENMAVNGAKSYVNQFLPTALGQVAKITDDKIRSTTSTKQGTIPKAIDSARMQMMSKIPRLSKQLNAKTDVWGEEQKRDSNIAKRVLQESFLPWTEKTNKTNAVNTELLNLYDKTGEKTILPTTSIEKDFTIDGNKYRMTDNEYAEFKKNYGTTSKKILDDLIKSKTYKSMTDEQKEKAISNIYSYSIEANKKSYANNNKLPLKTSTLYNTVQDIQKQKGNVSNYFEYLGKIDEMKKDSDKINILLKSNYTDKDKKTIYSKYINEIDTTYNLLLEKSNININEYLKYKVANANEEFESDKKEDGTIKGKTISGSAKKKIYNYVNNNISDVESRLMILGSQYKLSNTERNKLVGYINSHDYTKEEKLKIYEKLSSNFTVYKDGTVKYK